MWPRHGRLIGGRASLISKIEKPAAVERLDEILELSDAVMVARGDLGVELEPEQVPPLQKTDRRIGAAFGQTCRGGDADARIYDQGTGSHTRRSVRRGHGSV